MAIDSRVKVTFVVDASGAVRVLKGTEDALGKTGKAAVGASAGIVKLGAAVIAANQAMQLLQTAGRAADRVLSAIIDTGGGLEQRMANIATLIDGDATTAVMGFTQGIQSLIATVPKSADDLGAAAYQIVSAGISNTSDALKVLEASGKLAVAGLSTTAESANILTSALNAFNISSDQANRTAEILFLTVKGGKTTVSELAAQFGAVAPIAAAAGVKIEELQAATAALTTAGVATSEAQTNLRQAIVSLLKPTDTMKKILDQLGVSSGRELIAAKGLVGALQSIKEAAAGNSEVLARAFGRVQALTAAISLSGPTAEKFASILDSITTSVGEFDQAFAKAADTIPNQIQLLANQAEALRSKLFVAVRDDIKTTISAVSALNDELLKFIQSFPEGSKLIARLIVFVAELIKITASLGGVAVTFALLATLAPGVASAIAIVAGSAAGLVAAIAAISAATGAVRSAFASHEEGLVAIAGAYDDATEAAKRFNETAPLLRGAGKIVERLGPDLIDEVNQTIDKAKDALQAGNRDLAASLIANEVAALKALAKELEPVITEVQGRSVEVALGAGTVFGAASQQFAGVETALDVVNRLMEQLTGTTEQFGLAAETSSAKARDSLELVSAALDKNKEQREAQTAAAQSLVELRQKEIVIAAKSGATTDMLIKKAQLLSQAMQDQAEKAIAIKEATLKIVEAIDSGSPVAVRLRNEIEALQIQLNGAGASAAVLSRNLERAITASFGNRLATAKSIVDLRRKELEIAKAQQQPESQLVALAMALRDAQLVAAEQTIRLKEELLKAVQAIDPGSDRVAKLAADLELARAQVAGINVEFDKTVAGIKKVETQAMSTGNAIAQSLQRGLADAFEGVVLGTRKLSSVFQGVLAGLVRDFANTFAKIIVSKTTKLDRPITKNVGGLTGVFQEFGSEIAFSFAQVFSLINDGFSGLNAAAMSLGIPTAISSLLGTAGAGGIIGSVIGGKAGGIGGAIGGVLGKLFSGTAAGQFVTTAVLSTIGKALGSVLSVSVAEGLSSLFGALFAGLSNFLLPGLGILLGALIGKFLGGLFGPSNRRKASTSLEKFLEQATGLPIVRKAELGSQFAGDFTRGDVGSKPLSNRAITLGLLTASRIKSPFDQIPEFKLFDIATGQLETQFRKFPGQIEKSTQGILDSLGFGLAGAIDAIQNEIVTIAQQTAGKTIEANPKNLPGFETERGSLKRLVEQGFLIPIDQAVKEVVALFSKDLPRSVRVGLDAIVDSEFEKARSIQKDKTKITTVSGEQIQRRIELAVEAFGALADVIVKTAVLIQKGVGKQKVAEAFGDQISAVVQKRATEGITKAFLESIKFDNLLEPLFNTLDEGIKRILDAKTSRQARQRIDELINFIGEDFGNVLDRLNKLAPVIEQLAETQERIRLALTSFAQAARQLGTVIDNIDLAIADFQGRGGQARLDVAAQQAQERRATARQQFNRFLRRKIGVSGGRRIGDLSAVSDEDLKRSVGLIDNLAASIVQSANAEIAALQQRLVLTKQWIDLLPGARDALAQVMRFGLPQSQVTDLQLTDAKQRFDELTRQFRTGTDAERAAAAKQLAQLGPQLLQLAERAGFLPGSTAFESLRQSIASVLQDVITEASKQQAKADKIQADILDVQQQAAKDLMRLRKRSERFQNELLRRSELARRETQKRDERDRGKSQQTLDTAQRTLEVLQRGINVVTIKRDAFEPINFNRSMAEGGLVTAPVMPALLHGPELVVPLNKLPALGGNTQLSINQQISASLVKESDDPDEMDFQKMMLKLLPRLMRRPDVKRVLRDAVKGR